MNYKVYQGDELKQTVTDKIAVMNGLQPNKTYDFSVQPDDDNVQTVGGRTRYTHVAYANSSDSERNMNNWVLSDPAKQAAKITYKDGVNMIDFTGVGDFEVFNFPVKAKKGQSFTVSFSWTQPDVESLYGMDGGVPVSIADAPLAGIQVGRNVIYLGVSETSSKLFTISGTATADETYVSINLGFLTDGIQWQFKASFQQDFSQDLGNHEYVGWYSDFIATDSNDPSQYAWSPNATTSVTTRGIRFNIPKTLTVGSNITLRYEEYPLGIVPIGNEPSGYFGGGNKQNLSAKVISTANGSSVVEVAGNVIDVGGRNLLTGTTAEFVTVTGNSWAVRNLGYYSGLIVGNQYIASASIGNADHAAKIEVYAIKADGYHRVACMGQVIMATNSRNSVTFTWPDLASSGVVGVILNSAWTNETDSGSYQVAQAKLEPGTIATPYASFVDGDTFTAQPDGTCALFSEHKALYY